MRRVVITGVEMVTPIGNSLKDSWSNLKNGKIGLEPIRNFDTSFLKIKIAGEVKNIDFEKFIDAKDLRRMDRLIALGLYTTKMLNLKYEDNNDIGIILGNNVGGIENIYNQSINLKEKGFNRISPLFVPMSTANMLTGQISLFCNLKGFNFTLSSACASGTHAIGESFLKIKSGMADIVLTGGCESSICALGLGGFNALKALSTNENGEKASRPFDEDRNGFVMSEGACILVLEELESAIKRNATIYAEIVGVWSNLRRISYNNGKWIWS